jgi:glutamate synthase domain-containing protein 3
VGGLIAVYGSAGMRVGVSLQGADVLIRGNAGADVGFGMRSGTIIIGGSAGPNLGRGMRGGTIYVRGEATDVCSDIEEVRMREPDRLKLGLLLMKSGIKSSSGKEFRVYRPRADA